MKEKHNINETREWWKLYLGLALALFGMGIVVFSLVMPPVGAIHASVVTIFGTILTWIGAMFGIDSNTKIKMHEQEIDFEMRARELDDKMKRFDKRHQVNITNDED